MSIITEHIQPMLETPGGGAQPVTAAMGDPKVSNSAAIKQFGWKPADFAHFQGYQPVQMCRIWLTASNSLKVPLTSAALYQQSESCQGKQSVSKTPPAHPI